jgi:endonuclease/exonuclease/phosphatase family metal-dependent hydrolase
MLARTAFRDAVPTARVATTPRRHLLEPGRHIDWAFVRSTSQSSDGRVLTSVKASDHYPIFFELRLSDAEQKITSSRFMSLF